MNAADYIIVIVLTVSLLFGMARGFMREALSLLSWLGGMWIAWRFAEQLKPLLGGVVAVEPLHTWAARAAILVAVVVVGWMIAEVLSYFISHSGLSILLDRVLGMLFGFIRGAVVVALLSMLGLLLNLDEMRWWKKSTVLPYAVDMSQWIEHFAETGLPVGANAPTVR